MALKFIAVLSADIICIEDGIYWLDQSVFLDREMLTAQLSSFNKKIYATLSSSKRQIEFLRTRWLVNNVCGVNVDYEVGEGIAWPTGIKGSVAHKDGHVAVAVSRELEIIGVGIDLEKILTLRPHLAENIMSENEQEKFNSPLDGLIIFTVKEALFKCHYPVGKIRFYFHDAVVCELNKCTFGFFGTVQNLVSTSKYTGKGFVSHFKSYTHFLNHEDLILTLVVC